jgi:hypothetical protein
LVVEKYQRVYQQPQLVVAHSLDFLWFNQR